MALVGVRGCWVLVHMRIGWWRRMLVCPNGVVHPLRFVGQDV